MALFKWYKKYSVNNIELDRHHETLFGIFNRLYDNCSGHNTAYSIDTIIDELISYSGYHFFAEEQSMRYTGYKEINKHIIEHNDFTHRILKLQQVCSKNETQAKRELIIYLGDWILHHIIEEDKNYAANFIKGDQHGNNT